MTFPAITAFHAGLLGILFVALSIWVSMGRAQFKVHHGDGGKVPLQRRIRIQANFAEYVPLALLLIGLNEAAGAADWIIRSLLVALLIARLVHPVGMVAPEGSLQQYALRAPAMMVTWTVIAIASAMLTLR
ncbi:MAPEG family protein [Ruixingdingia sedimenti]|uniref:MAPEG family protein n=1 Tax=Ruixingdingia sedimenti TaxID=3073604 RepID=A0ABU1FDQ1_9RHOB|nr:MAPEG family protein [Xinfangfangia sp. LG-4]MDR5654997.1 MAPEG family protein [Xinfangfangia sp. LG-4]